VTPVVAPRATAIAAPARRADSAAPSSPAAGATAAAVETLAALQAGRIRAAEPDAAAVDGWRVEAAVKSAILAVFANRATADSGAGPLPFRDRVGLEPIDPGPGRRIVPGGTAIRAGAHLEADVVVMPPSYVNVGAWIGEGTMVDSHVLVGSCAQIGSRVHLSAGVTIGGVLEPPSARPVIVEDDAFVGAGCRLLDGVLIRRGAVLASGVTLTGTSRVFDLVEERELVGTEDRPLVIPAGAVVVPGSRPVRGRWGAERGLAISTMLIVKRRDAGTSARVALETALRDGPNG
jgi:2,3,4,5-tetrahydropyridine-2,6-dicarboxylate N-succinyltransferase